MSAREPALVVEGARKSFGPTVALAGVDLVVEDGVWGLLGANGAGKTTLMRAIVGLGALDSGTIRVCGLSVGPRHPEIRRLVGYLPEEASLDPQLTGRELLSLVAVLKGASPSAAEAIVRELGAERHLDFLLGQCSHGGRQKIALAAALVGMPRLIVLDEPLNGLDAFAVRELRRRIERMRAEGTTFVISSHDLSFVERVCDRVAVLRRGSIVAAGTPSELRAESGLGEAPFDDVFLALAGDQASDSRIAR